MEEKSVIVVFRLPAREQRAIFVRLLAEMQGVDIAVLAKRHGAGEAEIDFRGVEGSMAQQVHHQHEIILLEIHLEGKVVTAGMRGKIVTAIKRPGIDGLESPRQEIRVCRADAIP